MSLSACACFLVLLSGSTTMIRSFQTAIVSPSLFSRNLFRTLADAMEVIQLASGCAFPTATLEMV